MIWSLDQKGVLQRIRCLHMKWKKDANSSYLPITITMKLNTNSCGPRALFCVGTAWTWLKCPYSIWYCLHVPRWRFRLLLELTVFLHASQRNPGVAETYKIKHLYSSTKWSYFHIYKCALTYSAAIKQDLKKSWSVLAHFKKRKIVPMCLNEQVHWISLYPQRIFHYSACLIVIFPHSPTTGMTS